MFLALVKEASFCSRWQPLQRLRVLRVRDGCVLNLKWAIYNTFPSLKVQGPWLKKDKKNLGERVTFP